MHEGTGGPLSEGCQTANDLLFTSQSTRCETDSQGDRKKKVEKNNIRPFVII